MNGNMINECFASKFTEYRTKNTFCKMRLVLKAIFFYGRVFHFHFSPLKIILPYSSSVFPDIKILLLKYLLKDL